MQEIQLHPQDLCLPRCCRCLLFGSSMSGKTEFMRQLIKNRADVFAQPYSRFVFCSPNLDSDLSSPTDEAFKQNLIELASPQEIVFYNHVITLPELEEESRQGSEKTLVFLDDFSQQIMGQDVTCELFLRLSSHCNVDTVCALHSGINSKSGKNYGMITNSANVVVLFRSLADRANIGNMSKEMFPYASNFLEKCINMSTDLLGNYANIVIMANLDNDLNKTFMVKANLFGSPLLGDSLSGDEIYGDNHILFKNPAYYATGKP